MAETVRAVELIPAWTRSIHQRPNLRALSVDADQVHLAERTSRVSSVDARSGRTRWTARVPDSWGALATTGDGVHYVSQGGTLLSFRRDDGALVRETAIGFAYLGYLVACSGLLITGGWRGYSDLIALDAGTHERRWSRPVRSRTLVEFDRPVPLDEDRLIVTDREAGTVDVLDVRSGRTLRRLALPPNVPHVDSGPSFRTIGGRIVLATPDGRLHVSRDGEDGFDVERLALAPIDPIPPWVSERHAVFRHATGDHAVVDRRTGATVWRGGLDGNRPGAILAGRVDEDHVLVCGRAGNGWLVNVATGNEGRMPFIGRTEGGPFETGGTVIRLNRGALRADRVVY